MTCICILLRRLFSVGGKRGAGIRGPGVRGPGVRDPGVRGTGSRGVENAGSSGKRGVWWKTRGLVENAVYHIFPQNMNFPQ